MPKEITEMCEKILQAGNQVELKIEHGQIVVVEIRRKKRATIKG